MNASEVTDWSRPGAPVAQLHAEGEELILMMWYPSAIWEQTTNPTMSVVSI